MTRVVRVGATLGIKRIRVTGGEPLTRPGIAGFCGELTKIPGIEGVGISTNGTLLGKTENGITLAERLVKGGVRTANISLDSLDRATYQRTTSRDLLPRVLEGIDAAIEAGFDSIRLNCVLMKGQTERELPALIEFTRQKNALLRFIELMPVSTQAKNATVPNSRNDIPCLKLSIHAPGRGSADTRDGTSDSSKNGLASPIPIIVNISIACAPGSVTV
jgi:cyclic pyranopterin phosphate synthase